MQATTRLLIVLAVIFAACTPAPNDTDGGSGSSGGSGTTTASTSDATTTTSTAGTTSPTSTGNTTSPTTSSGSTSSTSTSDTTSTTSETNTTTAGTTGEPPPADACGMDGGICVGAGTCVQEGGTVAPSSPGGCFFDDGPAECCVPPGPKPDATTCTDAGGLCAPIGGCLQVGGYLTTIDDGCEFQGVFACCVPHDSCGDQTIECCEGDAIFNPACDGGMFVCPVGMPKPLGTCL